MANLLCKIIKNLLHKACEKRLRLWSQCWIEVCYCFRGGDIKTQLTKYYEDKTSTYKRRIYMGPITK